MTKEVLIVSWNINSINARLEHLLTLLKDYKPDVVLLQEIKTAEKTFPSSYIEDLGYNIVINGQPGHYGVAILSKAPIEALCTHILTNNDIPEARYIDGIVNFGNTTLRVGSVYVPNGTEISHNKYFYKLRFIEQLTNYMCELKEAGEKFLIGGDYNVAPEDIDVYDPKHLDGTLAFSHEERSLIRNMLNKGLFDAYRTLYPNKQEFSWWDYRRSGWAHNKGMRIDYIVIPPSSADILMDAGSYIEFRAMPRPSDHIPVYVKLACI